MLLSCVSSPSCVLSYVVTDVINLSVNVGGRPPGPVLCMSVMPPTSIVHSQHDPAWPGWIMLRMNNAVPPAHRVFVIYTYSLSSGVTRGRKKREQLPQAPQARGAKSFTEIFHDKRTQNNYD